MTKEELFKSKMFKIAVPVITVALIFAIWEKGYQFGQWLYIILN